MCACVHIYVFNVAPTRRRSCEGARSECQYGPRNCDNTSLKVYHLDEHMTHPYAHVINW